MDERKAITGRCRWLRTSGIGTARQNYDCAFVDDGIDIGTVICVIPVVGHTPDLQELFTEYQNLAIAIGNSTVRERIYDIEKSTGYHFPNPTGQIVYISLYAKMGWGCVLLNNAVVQNGSIVGNGVLLNPGVGIHHDCTVRDYDLIYTNSVVRTYTKVGKYVRIGSNVIICNNAVVQDGTDIPDCAAVHPEVRV